VVHRGLGAAIAALFVERGARGVVICGRSQEKGEAKAHELSETSGTDVRYVQADLSQVDDCRAVIAAADARFGRIDVLVNAAAMTDRGTILDTDPALFDRIFSTNVRAPFFLMQETIRVMRRERIEGSIVNICSMSAMAGQPFIAAYCASKGALATLTQNTAYTLLRNRIRVNGLNLGWMGSDGEDRIQREYHGAADDWLTQASAAQPFGAINQSGGSGPRGGVFSERGVRPDDRVNGELRSIGMGCVRRRTASGGGALALTHKIRPADLSYRFAGLRPLIAYSNASTGLLSPPSEKDRRPTFRRLGFAAAQAPTTPRAV
jgi:NAD(P)-dependent dehydrogenase (short-subunit alcohol dehydrogenase family)